MLAPSPLARNGLDLLTAAVIQHPLEEAGRATRHVLIHLTNSDAGRDLMKECAWSVSLAGEFTVRRSDNPDQQFLIQSEPELQPLRDWIIGRLSRRPEHWPHTTVRPEGWLLKHVNKVVRALKTEGVITADTAPGSRFGAAANPLLKLTPKRNGRCQRTLRTFFCGGG